MTQQGKLRRSGASLSLPVMFTVKATYRSETRKFTFPSPSFPTYSQINDQVNSLFLLFSPLSSYFAALSRIAYQLVLLSLSSPFHTVSKRSF